ncbi:MAG: lipoyl(octanoyl) transferase LipB [Actinomyces urogenitalis]|uniref:Octanoyltransferase n=1 Tax=Actinomyces urogenitalis TaxID=103621 RepID=A0A2I1KUU9_9ACTO|nr:lipoyl(octanoyl) transferase LipB [Actinomyces urogenitalis]MBS5976023.1 lipoyl(octanoyl) transferase LipB [Actinomyces urogenitalis]MDU0971301.1 lipoyl(octanoyl) transferase LipB [Actinomyces urogenitalis]MDU6151158.1 lipoyl(octanoyl) transferase LipB [Actinomyces urogenitalis]MDU7427231.1 lipoyl(octanoyl) transferase LipB [Actinomyces urogenitalis]PKY99401.1 lipoate-protein ligase B [Actinomyces urogenitalis]
MQRLDLDLASRLVPYPEARALQQQVHDEVVAGTRPGTLILVEHESVYTVGRRAHSWERPAGDVVEPGHVPVIEVDRGGKTTWHGPGQLTVYPIVRLASPIDVIKYVRALEAAVMEVCAAYGVRTMRVEGRSGVWVPPAPGSPPAARERKICALGVRVARGVTLHGIGLNVDPDLAAFGLDRIIPCGIDDAGVTSLAVQTGRHLATSEPADAVVASLQEHLAPLTAEG